MKRELKEVSNLATVCEREYDLNPNFHQLLSLNIRDSQSSIRDCIW
jgi:hypothetical protein